MKKPPKMRSAAERAKHRNPQLRQLKRASVHPAAPPDGAPNAPSAPKGNLPRRKLKPGQPNLCSKLTAELSQKICACVAIGMSWQDAAKMVGVHRNMISLWKAKGDADPQSAYGQFLKAAETAELSREAVHLKFIAEDKDWKARRWLLCNFRPDKYRMTSFLGELMGKDGAPLIPAAENSFHVVLELAGSQPEPDREFVVEQVGGARDGQREVWQPPSNGQKPP